MAGKRVAADQPVLRLEISGPGVRSGRITVPDLLRICEQVQVAVNRQAEALEQRESLRPGPYTAKVKIECTLELLGIRKGSTILPFAIAKPQMVLPETATLGSQAVLELATTIESLQAGKYRHADAGVLDSLNTLGSIFERKTINRIEFVVPRAVSKKRQVRASFTPAVRDRVVAQIKSPSERAATVEGILEMADFKPGDHRCRINTPLGSPVLGLFAENLESTIQENLRRPVRVTGMATVNPYSDRIEAVRISAVEPIASFAVGKGEFLKPRSFEELAALQDVKPLKSIGMLAGVFSETENLDEMLDEIYRERT